jgi:hypothetical protein
MGEGRSPSNLSPPSPFMEREKEGEESCLWLLDKTGLDLDALSSMGQVLVGMDVCI